MESRITLNQSQSRESRKYGDAANIVSFSPFSDLESQVFAPVNITNASREFSKFIDEKLDFQSEVILNKGRKMWEISFLPSKTLDLKSQAFNSFLKVRELYSVREIRIVVDKTKKKNTLLLQLSGWKIELQFKFVEHYLYFKKTLIAVVKIKNDKNRDSLFFDDDDGKRVRIAAVPKFKKRKLCIINPASKISNQKGDISTLINSLMISNDNSSLFHEKRSDNWTFNEFTSFLECIYIDTIDHGAVTVFEYIKNQKNMLKNLTKFMTNQSEYRNCSFLEEELLKTDVASVDRLIVPFYNDIPLRTKLLHWIRDLNDRDGYFNPCYSLVLKKRMRKKMSQSAERLHRLQQQEKARLKVQQPQQQSEPKSIEQYESIRVSITGDIIEKKQSAELKNEKKKKVKNKPIVHLKEIESELQFGKRYWWDVEECKSHILSLLIFHKDFATWVLDMEKKFRDFELYYIRKSEETEETEGEEEEEDDEIKNAKKKKKKKWLPAEERKKRMLGRKTAFGGGGGTCLPLSEKELMDLDPRLWTRILRKFNEMNGNIRIEQISFRIHIACQQNRLRASKLQSSQELNQAQSSLKKLKDDRARQEIKLESIERQINSFVSMIGTTEMTPEAQGKLLKSIETRKKNFERLQKQLDRTRERFKDQKHLVGTLEEQIRDEINPAILKCSPELRIDQQETFLRSTNRQAHIQQLLKNSLEKQLKVKGMGEFVIKLVLSYRKSDDVNTWQSLLMSKMDPLFRPGFYRWGFLHANILIASVGVHWFANSLCYLNDLSLGDEYEEICAIDCFCALLVDIDTIDKKITELAEEIVVGNVNYEYATFQLLKKDKLKLNCQEYAYRLMNILDATPFFPIVQKYIDQLKSVVVEVNHNSQEIISRLRWIPLDPSSVNPNLVDFVTQIVNESRHFEFSIRKEEKEGKGGKLYFSCHSEVDRFYWLCSMKDDKFQLKFPGLVQLLKSFCRAFHMLFNLYPSKERYAPMTRVHLHDGCPFEERKNNN